MRTPAGAALLLGVLCSFLGFAWDVQWHVDVGPDTFFTAPHLVLYSGIALIGLVCLAVTLATTAAARGGDPAAFVGTTAMVGGLVRAPLGYLVAGFGAASFLLYGLLDQWWHAVYGFDVTLVSPPHVGLTLSIFVTMLGALLVFTAAVQRPGAGVGSTLGFCFALAVLVAFVTPTLLDAAPWFLGPVSWPGLATSLLVPAALLLAVAVLRRPGAATLASLAFLAVAAVAWALVPWLTREYAAAVGLFLRDTTANQPVVPGMLPTWLPLAAVAVDAVAWRARVAGWPVRPGVLLAGALAAFLLNAVQPFPPIFGVDHGHPAALVAEMAALQAAVRLPTLLLAPLVGAPAALVGWLLGIVARQSTAPAAGGPAPAAAAGAGQ